MSYLGCFCFFGGVGEMGSGLSSLPCPSFSTVHLQSPMSLPMSSIFTLCALQKRGSWASAWSLASAQARSRTPGCSWATDPDKILRCNWDHRQQRGGFGRHGPTDIPPGLHLSVAARAQRHIIMAPGGSIGHSL